MGNTRTTEVVVTSDSISEPTAILGISTPPVTVDRPIGAYSVVISSTKQTAGSDQRPRTPGSSRRSPLSALSSPFKRSPTVNRNMHDVNNAALSYTKCALLFFAAICITWAPSSANRLFSVIHKGDRSVPLEYVSATVLPLQGFWNAIIYAMTSWKAVKALYKSVVSGKFRWRQPAHSERLPDVYTERPRPTTARHMDKDQTESMTEMDSRPTSRHGNDMV